MENNQSNKECWRCGNYGAYYTKGYCHFNKTNQGFCSKHQETKNKHESCIFWRSKPSINGIRKKVAKKVLLEILINLSSIKQILQEEQQNEK